MADIKTRKSKTGVKVIDKAAVAGERMKQAYIKSKDKVESSTEQQNSSDEYAADKYENTVEDVTREGVHQLDKAGRKGLEETKDNISEIKDKVDSFRQKRNEKKNSSSKDNPSSSNRRSKDTAPKNSGSSSGKSGTKSIKTAETSSKKSIKQSASSAGKKTVKTSAKSVKTTGKSVKTAEKGVKTAEKTAQAAKKAAQATAKAAKAAKAAAEATAKAVKVTVKAIIAAIKAIIAAIKGLVALIAAGGWVAVVIIIVIVLIALIVGSVYGIFFSGEDTGTGMTMQSAISSIEQKYNAKIEQVRNESPHDVLEISNIEVNWKDVLAVYAVNTTMAQENAQDVAVMDETRLALLEEVFWQMTFVHGQTDERFDYIIHEKANGKGGIVQTYEMVKRRHLRIRILHKTAQDIAKEHYYTKEKCELLAEFTSPEYDSLWEALTSEVEDTRQFLSNTGETQLGESGEKYWTWYGFDSEVDWSACFVSWCANQNGFIDIGLVPKFAQCPHGELWFKDHNQWQDGKSTPEEGMLIFLDNAGNTQDGVTDKVGIVMSVSNNVILSVIGDSAHTVQIVAYEVGHKEIYGYGLPRY